MSTVTVKDRTLSVATLHACGGPSMEVVLYDKVANTLVIRGTERPVGDYITEILSGGISRVPSADLIGQDVRTWRSIGEAFPEILKAYDKAVEGAESKFKPGDVVAVREEYWKSSRKFFEYTFSTLKEIVGYKLQTSCGDHGDEKSLHPMWKVVNNATGVENTVIEQRIFPFAKVESDKRIEKALKAVQKNMKLDGSLMGATIHFAGQVFAV